MTIFELSLHEELTVGDFKVIRVAGGWLYKIFNCTSNTDSTTFVPYNAEFSNLGEFNTLDSTYTLD